MTDVFEIQSAIAQNIASSLKTVLLPEEKERVEHRQTTDLTAYHYYLKGREYYNRDYHPGYDHAIEFYKKALKLDPNYALAYVGLADEFNRRGAGVRRFPRAWIDSAITMCNKAITIDPNISEAYSAIGLSYQEKGWFQKALEAYYKAIELNASNWRAIRTIGDMNRDIGNYQEALKYQKAALQIDPTVISTYTSIAKTYFYLKDYDESINWHKRKMKLAPEVVQLYLAVVYMEQGKIEQAVEIVEEMIQSDSTQEYVYHDPAIMLNNHGMTKKAITMLKKALEINPQNGWHYMALAGIYIEQGKLDAALTLYQRGMEQVKPYLYMSLSYSFLLSSLGRIQEAREILAGITVPENHWNEPVVLFYLGEITESEMETAMRYTFVEVGGKRELFTEISYYLGMAYLHNLDQIMHGSPGYVAKAIEYLQKYHLLGDKLGVENAVVRAELRRLGAL
jgi:tetratricopeptide (TPR) repeat protein